MLLPPPEFFCNSCLNLHLDKIGRLELAKVAGVGEPCVRGWQRDNRIPQEAIDLWADHLGQIGDGEILEGLNIAMEKPFLVAADAFKWQSFCQGILANDEAFLPYTFGEILRHSKEWLTIVSSARNIESGLRFDYTKNHILKTLGPRYNLPPNLEQHLQKSKDWGDIRPVLAWLFVEAFIYYLSLAEAECLWVYHSIKERKLSDAILPIMHKGKIQYPVKRFFGFFFDSLISKGFYQSLDAIAERMPRILPLNRKARKSGKSPIKVNKDSGWREIKRAKYQGKAPTLETFRAWAETLLPSNVYPGPKEKELEVQLLCDGLGAARIVDRFFREVSKDVPAQELLARFESYDLWFQHHHLSVSSK